jgi:hypothetical protein
MGGRGLTKGGKAVIIILFGGCAAAVFRGIFSAGVPG